MSQTLLDYWQVALSLFAVVLAVLAFAVSLRSFWETRKHNRFSVMPFVEFHWVRGPDDTFRHPGIWVTNNGAGVAIMEDLIVSVGDEPAVSLQQALRNTGFLARLALPLVYHGKLGRFLGPGEKRCLFGIPEMYFTGTHRALMEADLLLLTLYLKYESMYRKQSKAKMDFISLHP